MAALVAEGHAWKIMLWERDASGAFLSAVATLRVGPLVYAVELRDDMLTAYVGTDGAGAVATPKIPIEAVRLILQHAAAP